jgi:hypothetical protein
MTSDGKSGPTLQQQFQERILAAIREVRRYTRLGVRSTLEDIQRVGALQAVKARLRPRTGNRGLDEFFDMPGAYFFATKRIRRMDLSVEAIALDPAWRGLFASEEVDTASATLTEHGFIPALG